MSDRPYADAAMVYLSRGWAPLPLPPRRKASPPDGWTGHGAPWPSGADVAEWSANGHGAGNIAIRMPDHVIGIDVDDYDDKGGGKTLAGLEDRLGPLPPSPRSTSRPDDPVSGIRFYRVPGGLHWHDPGPGIEVIQHTYRYAAVAPSLHPEGRPYVWLAPDESQMPGPAVDELPELPDAWVQDLGREATGRRTGRWSDLDRASLDPRDFAALEALEKLGGHGAFQADGYVAITRPGKVAGTSASIGHIGPGLVKVFTPNWPRLENGRVYDAGQLAALGPDRAADDADEFWSARDELRRIREYALAHRASPWATLVTVLARIIAMIPPGVVLPPLVGGPASLNLFGGLVGVSGSGKGAAQAAGEAAVRFGLGPRFEVYTLGSGQGIAHAYMAREKGVLIQHATSALFVVEEVDLLAQQSRQTGGTLLAELRRLYMAERLGYLYVDPAKRMPVPAHAYRAAVLVQIQPARAGIILDDSDGGLPQRFLWAPTAYPHADVKPGVPEPIQWTVPEPVTQARGGRLELHVRQSAAAAIDAAALARSRGEGDPLDGHRLLCREKTAAALGFLAGHAGITEQDWQLAEVVMNVSDLGRQMCVDAIAAKSSEVNRRQAEAEAIRTGIIGDRLEEEATQRVARALLRILSAAGDWVPRGILRHKLAQRDRARFDEVIERLIAAGQIQVEQTSKGDRYRAVGERS